MDRRFLTFSHLKSRDQRDAGHGIFYRFNYIDDMPPTYNAMLERDAMMHICSHAVAIGNVVLCTVVYVPQN